MRSAMWSQCPGLLPPTVHLEVGSELPQPGGGIQVPPAWRWDPSSPSLEVGSELPQHSTSTLPLEAWVPHLCLGAVTLLDPCILQRQPGQPLPGLFFPLAGRKDMGTSQLWGKWSLSLSPPISSSVAFCQHQAIVPVGQT